MDKIGKVFSVGMNDAVLESFDEQSGMCRLKVVDFDFTIETHHINLRPQGAHVIYRKAQKAFKAVNEYLEASGRKPLYSWRQLLTDKSYMAFYESVLKSLSE